MVKELEHLTDEERLGGLGLFYLGREDREDLSNLHKYQKGRCKGDGARLFPVAPSDTTTGTSKTQEAPPEHQETLFLR